MSVGCGCLGVWVCWVRVRLVWVSGCPFLSTFPALILSGLVQTKELPRPVFARASRLWSITCFPFVCSSSTAQSIQPFEILQAKPLAASHSSQVFSLTCSILSSLPNFLKQYLSREATTYIKGFATPITSLSIYLPSEVFEVNVSYTFHSEPQYPLFNSTHPVFVPIFSSS